MADLPNGKKLNAIVQMGKEPVMIYATANIDHYIPIRNLSTTHTHYTTDTDLCSTTKNTCRTYRSHTDHDKPIYSFRGTHSSTPGSLSSTGIHIFRPYGNILGYHTAIGNLYRSARRLTPNPLGPDITLWPTTTEPQLRSGTSLGSTITNPLRSYYGLL